MNLRGPALDQFSNLPLVTSRSDITNLFNKNNIIMLNAHLLSSIFQNMGKYKTFIKSEVNSNT